MPQRSGAGFSRRRWLAICSGALGISACRKAGSSSASRKASRSSGKLQQEGYVWQRLWTPAVEQAVRQAQNRVDGFSILAAEVEWDGARPRVIRANLNHRCIVAAGKPAALAVRIGPFAGPFGENDPATQQVREIVRNALSAAKSGGWMPSEVHVDFDCATAKLSGYQSWLRLICQDVAPLPVTFTALPDWLRSPVLREMARECSNWVLQVHAVERARPNAAQPYLLDVEAARRWVDEAGEWGTAFRVALPTYRSAVGFDATGKIIGIDSEGPARVWPRGARVVTYVSPAAEIARLVSEWTADRPSALRGVLWYRLPVAGESRNWTWKTLEPVMAGRAPSERLDVTTDGANPVDVFLTNAGEAESAWPQEVTVEAGPGRSVTAGDALEGYELKIDAATPGRAVFQRAASAEAQFLPPERKKALGWLRFSSQISTDPSTRAHELKITLH